jgi:hypothetical protein
MFTEIHVLTVFSVMKSIPHPSLIPVRLRAQHFHSEFKFEADIQSSSRDSFRNQVSSKRGVSEPASVLPLRCFCGRQFHFKSLAALILSDSAEAVMNSSYFEQSHMSRMLKPLAPNQANHHCIVEKIGTPTKISS